MSCGARHPEGGVPLEITRVHVTAVAEEELDNIQPAHMGGSVERVDTWL